MVIRTLVLLFLSLSISKCNLIDKNSTCQLKMHVFDCNYRPFESVREEFRMFDELKNTLHLRRKAHQLLRSQFEELRQMVPDRSSRSHYLEALPNSFALVRRLTNTWLVLRAFIGTTFEQNAAKILKLPLKVREVWNSAVTGLVRLQETYNLNTTSIASGSMAGAYDYTSLSADECFDVGVFYYRLRHLERAEEWFKEALQRAQHHQKPRIMEYLHIVYCFAGNTKRSSDTLLALLKDFPNFSPSEELQSDYNEINTDSCIPISAKRKLSQDKDWHDVHNVDMQAGLCRPENLRPPKDPRLRCRYIHHNRPHLRLAPFKLEELNIEPPLIMFHGVIHDMEINHFKTLYHNRTRHAIYDHEYNSETNPYVDTQQTYFLDSHDPIDLKVTRRASDAINMNLRYAESSMLASYGIAGEIKVHDDLQPGAEVDHLVDYRADHGTYLFYLSGVEEGGYTIYPDLNIAVVPVKGNALFWFNRYPDLSKIENVIHSGCPVLRGNKWILSKWFHSSGQEFPLCLPGKEHSYGYFYL